jgi:hypothetical protein
MGTIGPDTIVGDILQRYPAALDIFISFGFTPLRNKLLRKALTPLISVAGACRVKHLTDEQQRQLLAALNALADHPQTDTPSAAAEEAEEPPVEVAAERVGDDWHLDNRGLEPPEPMTRILQLLPRIGPNERIIARNDREPMFLYPRLDQMGYHHQTEPCDDGSFRITISKAAPQP